MGILEGDKFNCTTIFLLPAIGLSRKDILEYGFISAYLDDKHHEPHYESAVYVLFKPAGLAQGENLEDFIRSEYRTKDYLIEDYDYKGGYVVLVYKVPRKYMADYELFLKGSYSKFSPGYKSLFPEKVEAKGVGGDTEIIFSVPYLVFIKGGPVKRYWEKKLGVMLDEDMEYWSAPDIGGLDSLDIKMYGLDDEHRNTELPRGKISSGGDS